MFIAPLAFSTELFIGSPHPGQDGAFFDTSRPHAGHFISDIVFCLVSLSKFYG